jgi:hypothetical protein
MPARPDHVLATGSLSRTGLLVTSAASRPASAPFKSNDRAFFRRPPSAPSLLRTPQHRVAPPRPQSASAIAQTAPAVLLHSTRHPTELMVLDECESFVQTKPMLVPDSCVGLVDLKISPPDDKSDTSPKVGDEDPSPTSIIASSTSPGMRGSLAPDRTRLQIEAALAEAALASTASPAA